MGKNIITLNKRELRNIICESVIKVIAGTNITLNESDFRSIVYDSVTKAIEKNNINEVHNFNNVLSKSNNSLNESSVIRMLQWLKDCDCAFITAFRSELKDIRDIKSTYLGPNNDWEVGKRFTHEENREKNRLMMAELLQSGYGVTKVNSREEAMDSIEKNRGADDEGGQIYWHDNDGTTFRGRKENRKSKMTEAIGFWRNMVDERMVITEDMHPLARKSMCEELRKMRQLKSSQSHIN